MHIVQNGRPRQRLAQALQPLQGGFGVCAVFQCHGEFIAANAANEVVWPCLGPQALRKYPKELVRQGLPPLLVEVLELVDVQQTQGQDAIGFDAFLEGRIQLLGKKAAAGQAGEGVVVAKLLQGLLQAALLGNILTHRDPFAHDAVRVLDAFDGDLRDKGFAIFAAPDQFAMPSAVSLDGLCDAAQECGFAPFVEAQDGR